MDMISGLEEEYRLYRRLFELTSLQRNASCNGDISVINRALSDKAAVVAGINKIMERRKSVAVLSPQHSERLAYLTGLIREMIVKVIEYEKESQEILTGLQKGISSQLSRINRGLQSAKSHPRGINPPKYISLKL